MKRILKVFILTSFLFLYSSRFVYADGLLTGCTSTADDQQVGNEASKAFDSDFTTRWSTNNVAFPHWIKCDLGSGKDKIIDVLVIKPHYASSHAVIRDFTVSASNDNSNWTVITSPSTLTFPDVSSQQIFVLNNSTSYRYYLIAGFNTWYPANYMSVYEFSGFYSGTLSSSVILTSISTDINEFIGQNNVYTNDFLNYDFAFKIIILFLGGYAFSRILLKR